jgi:hypothetical protein
LPAFAFAVRAAEQTPVDAIRNTEKRDKVKGLSWRFTNSIAMFPKRTGIWRTEGMHESWRFKKSRKAKTHFSMCSSV